MKGSEWAVQNARWKWSFPSGASLVNQAGRNNDKGELIDRTAWFTRLVRSKLYIEKIGSFLAFGLSQGKQWRIQTRSQGFWNPVKISKCQWKLTKISFFARFFWLRTLSKVCLDPPLENKMIPGNIKLSVSTVIPCKRPVSQLFRNFNSILIRGRQPMQLPFYLTWSLKPAWLANLRQLIIYKIG